MAGLGSRSLLTWNCLPQQRRPSRPLSYRLRDGQCRRPPSCRGAHWHATAGVQLRRLTGLQVALIAVGRRLCRVSRICTAAAPKRLNPKPLPIQHCTSAVVAIIRDSNGCSDDPQNVPLPISDQVIFSSHR